MQEFKENGKMKKGGMRMKFARTVCGGIQAEEMGFTYHMNICMQFATCQKDRDLEVSDYEGSSSIKAV